MQITAEHLRDQLADVGKQIEDYVASVHRAQGAEMLLKKLIELSERPDEPPPKRTRKQPPKKAARGNK